MCISTKLLQKHSLKNSVNMRVAEFKRIGPAVMVTQGLGVRKCDNKRKH